MAVMGRPRAGDGPGTHHGGRRRTAARLLAAATLVLTGCSPDDEPDRPPTSTSAPLRVATAPDTARIDAATQTELETAIGDVLSGYVVTGFLGDYPREDFVRSFDAFTGRAARNAAGDIDLLTASRFSEAAAVRATRLDARLSFVVDGRDVVGATATVNFEFEASGGEVGTTPFSLRGRLMLVEASGTWSVFGYDVTRDDPSSPGGAP
jgi:hypothetical protein